MKLRNGFVSNSSSSSFIIGFDSKPRNVEQLRKILFPNNEGVSYPFGGHEDVPAEIAAQKVWDQIKNQRPLSKSKLPEKLNSGWFSEKPEYCFDGPHRNIEQEYRSLTGKSIQDEDTPREWREKWNIAWHKHREEYQKNCINAAKRLARELLNGKFQGKKLYVCSFSDNDGMYGAVLEHGGTFKEIPHVQISHH